MKTISKLAVVAAVIALGSSFQSARVATNVAANVFLNVTITLNGLKQDEAGVSPVRIATKDIIAAIGTDTTNNFSEKAKLLLKFPVGIEAGPEFVIRDLVPNAVDFEVPSTILWLIQIGDSINASRITSSGIITGNQAAIYEFELQSSMGSFDVQGYTMTSLDNRGNAGDKLVDICPTTASSKVTGTGSDADGNSTVLQGSISASGRKVVNAN